MQEICEFFEESKKGLEAEIEDSDYDGLVKIMSHLLSVKERGNNITNNFIDLKKSI